MVQFMNMDNDEKCKLTSLDLSNQSIMELPIGIFDGLINLKVLRLMVFYVAILQMF